MQQIKGYEKNFRNIKLLRILQQGCYAIITVFNIRKKNQADTK